MHTLFRIFVAVTFLSLLACGGDAPKTDAAITGSAPALPDGFPEFFKVGHRGARGLMPENTIPSMVKAVEAGANLIEVDVYTTRDGKVLVAHDPYVNTTFTLDSSGREIPEEAAKGFKFHQMNYADIRRFDVGSKPHKSFPQQANIKVYMPLLDELIDSVEAFTRSRGLPPVIYNIELKSNPRYDSLDLNATPQELVDAVMQVVRQKDIGNRYYIQSFDLRPLQYAHEQYPEVVIGFLTSAKTLSVEENLEKLGFLPHMYSPEYHLVSPGLVKACRDRGMRLVPWTVNEKKDMQELMRLGVNGIITDYPDRLEEVLAETPR